MAGRAPARGGGALHAPRVETSRLRHEEAADGLAHTSVHVSRRRTLLKLDEGRKLGDHGVSDHAASTLRGEDQRQVRDAMGCAVHPSVADEGGLLRVAVEGELGIGPGANGAVPQPTGHSFGGL